MCDQRHSHNNFDLSEFPNVVHTKHGVFSATLKRELPAFTAVNQTVVIYYLITNTSDHDWKEVKIKIYNTLIGHKSFNTSICRGKTGIFLANYTTNLCDLTPRNTVSQALIRVSDICFVTNAVYQTVGNISSS